MRLPRFRLRTLLVAVAILPIAGAGAVELNRLLERRAAHRARAESHANSEWPNRRSARYCDSVVADWERSRRSGRWDAEEARNIAEYVAGARRQAERARKLAGYHAALRLKYDRAARYPWLPVEPDPPAP